MDGHEMKVAISNPPARRPPATSDPVTAGAAQQNERSVVRSLGGTSKQVIERLVSYIHVCTALLPLSWVYTQHCQLSPSPEKENNNKIINS